MKIGILGGTFDPIHYGHIRLAEEAKTQAGLDEILFMPAHISPFKINNQVTEDSLRYHMVKLAIENIQSFKAYDIEIRGKNKISYTINTLRDVKRELGDSCTLFFILGTDSFLDIEKWYKSEELLREVSFVVGSRPGYKERELQETICALREIYHCEIIKINNELVDISSTYIKECIRGNKEIHSFVPKKVEEFIRDSKLYL